MQMILLFSVIFVLFSSRAANAYLDPGTGSMVLQIILGGVAGLLVAGKLYWKRIKSFFLRNKDNQ